VKFSSLNTAVSGMNVAQANLYVTGHNTANVNTPGYTRQQVLQKDAFSQTIGRTHGHTMQVGLGSNVQSIRQIRDRFLDMAFRDSAATVGYYSVMYQTGRLVETTIGELEGEYKLQSVLRDLKNHISELHNNMTGVETRGEFISSSISFVDKANDTYENLMNQQMNMNENIIVMTRRVNELITAINHYSGLVRINEFTGDNANDYRDVVNAALDELSNYLHIDYRIGPNYNISIFSEGRELLSNGHQTFLGLRYCSPNTNFVEVVLNPSTDILHYDDESPLFFKYNHNIEPARGNDKGGLKGLIVARGLRPVTFADSEAQIRARFEAATVRLNAELRDPARTRPIAEIEKEIRLVNLQFERDIFNINNCIIPMAQLQLDTLINSIVNMINDTLAPRELLNPYAQPGDPDFNIYVKTHPYPFGQDGSQLFMPIFVRKSEYFQGDPNTGRMVGEITDESDPMRQASLFTIGNFMVNPALRSQSGYKLMTLSRNGDAEDQRLLRELLDKWDSRIVGIDDQAKVSIEEFYQRMVTNLSVEIQRYKTINESELEVLNATENRRLSMSGVALDEEMANMLRFQHAYQAAARIFNYIDSMLDTLINRTGRVGL